ncbi:MAG: glycosyltransferase family 4 protein [Candidatus Sericytochromatia bacterium]|nr:glycosyltransferase family 4 protein [Candidatus Sericytochromatia bacterium]
MSRILYAAFDPVPAPKGASRHIRALVEGLVADGHAVDLATLPARWQPLAWPGVRAWPLAQAATPNVLARADAFGAHVLALAQAGSHRAWHVRDVWQGVPLALWRDATGGTTPLIWEVNGLPSFELPVHLPGLATQPALLARLRALEQRLLRAADRLVAVSPVTARCLVDLGADPGRVRIVPNGVELAAFSPTAGDGEGPELLYVGTLAPWQGLDTLLAALALLPPAVRLRVIGPPGRGWAARLRGRAARLGVAGRVLLAPPLAPADVPAALARARVCVAPLDGSARNVVQGCCPLKLLEYAAAGRPIVASAVPPVEALFQHGESAWLVPPDDPAAWAQALQAVLADAALRARLAAGARALAEGWDWSHIQAAWRATYAELGVTAPAATRTA